MLGTLELLGRTHPVAKAELHLPTMDDSCWLNLLVAAEPDESFAVCGVELQLVRNMDELDGKRLHVRWPFEALADDSVGADPVGAECESDLNYWHSDDGNYIFVEVRIDFHRLAGSEFRCEVYFRLAGVDVELQESEPVPEELTFEARGSFTVTADEIDPYHP